MGNLDTDMQRMALFVVDCAVRALISTHPEPDAVQKAFDANLERMIATLLGEGASDQSIRMIEMWRERMTSAIQATARR